MVYDVVWYVHFLAFITLNPASTNNAGWWWYPIDSSILSAGVFGENSVGHPSSYCHAKYMFFSDSLYTQGDSNVISMSAGFRRRLVGKTLKTVCYSDVT